MTRTLLPACAVVSLLAAGTSATAQCVTVDPVIVPQIRVDPLDAAGVAELVQPFFLTFRRATLDGDAFTVRYQIVDEDSAAFARVGVSQGPLIEWTSIDSQRSIGALRSESYALMRTGLVVFEQAEPAVQRQAYVRLSDLRADLPAGVFREQFTIRFWCGDDETAVYYDTRGAVSVSAAVPNTLSANVAGASLRGEIDFMNFENRVRALQVSVRSTGPFRVTARSANGGVLLREGVTGSATPADRIAYRASFDGGDLTLQGGQSRTLPRAGLTGRQIPLEVRVDEVDRNRAGNYSDTLYVTLEPAS